MKLIRILFFTIIAISQYLLSQNLQEIQKLQNEYKKVLESQALQKPSEISDAEKTASSTALPDKLIYSRKDIESLLVNTEKLLEELKSMEDSVKKMPYVGYEFFTKRDSIPFWQNLPISKNYSLGPGDEIIISLWGESNSISSEVINRDGQIFIENIGIMNLGGKTVLEAKKYITSRYSRVYSTLVGTSPKSYLDLTLGELKSVNVHFVGFVNIPGVHLLHPFSNVVTGLIQAGGVNVKGSLRDIRIMRNNELIGSIDIYNYIINGNAVEDIRLMDQDIVYIPPRKSTIPIAGRVLRPGYYEILKNENLNDLINYSGGKDRFSANSVFLYKNGLLEKNGYLVNDSAKSDFKILQGDSIYVPMIPEFDNFIFIQGHVKNPGKYPYNKNIKLNDLLSATMSNEDEDFYKTMNLSNVIINRKNPNYKEPLRIKTSIDENVYLENGDYVNISRKNIFNPIETVMITGEIVSPGIYPVNNLTNLKDILTLSGGYTDLALNEGVQIFRDSLKIAWDNQEFILEDGDSLNVLKKSGLILVKGEVNVPGYVSYKKNDSVKKYIKRAGGFTSFADKGSVYISYPNGTSIPISGWTSPKVKEGSTIIINQRTISGRDKITGWEVFSVISSQAGNIATTLLSISLLINQTSNGN
tara:strand:+ start:226 stop:2154 length:1929 start_codon:yes stop_codon:yes gene_type:complete